AVRVRRRRRVRYYGLPRNNSLETSQPDSEPLAVRLPRTSYHELSVAPPRQAWRIEGYRQVLNEADLYGWTPQLERRAAWFLGYGDDETEERIKRKEPEPDVSIGDELRSMVEELRAFARLYGPLIGLCILFITALFFTDSRQRSTS